MCTYGNELSRIAVDNLVFSDTSGKHIDFITPNNKTHIYEVQVIHTIIHLLFDTVLQPAQQHRKSISFFTSMNCLAFYRIVKCLLFAHLFVIIDVHHTCTDFNRLYCRYGNNSTFMFGLKVMRTSNTSNFNFIAKNRTKSYSTSIVHIFALSGYHHRLYKNVLACR